MGNALAIHTLANPHAYPEQLRYLHRWSLELYARSGSSEHGMNSLTWESFDAWARNKGHALAEHEVDALFELDTALRSSGEPE